MIDYAAAYTQDTVRMIDAFIDNHQNYDYPLRVLLIERHTKDQPWWSESLTLYETNGATRKEFLHKEKLLALKPLPRIHQYELLPLYLEAMMGNSTQVLPEDKTDDFWRTLDEITDHGKPLFIAIVAVTILTEGVNGIRNWRIEDLLEQLLNREKKAWKERCGLNEKQLRDSETLFALATLCQGLDFKQHNDTIIDTLNHYELIHSDLEKLGDQLEPLTSQQKPFALEPDIFGEYFLLQTLKKPKRSSEQLIKKILIAAWTLNKEECGQIISRCTMDFGHIDTPLWWVTLLQTVDDEQADHRLLLSKTLSAASYYYGEANEYLYVKNAIVQLQQLAKQSPDNAEIQFRLSGGLNDASLAFYLAGKLDEALLYLEKLQQVAKPFPDNVEIQLQVTQGLTSAMVAFSQAGTLPYLAQLQQAAQPFPDNTEIQLKLATGLYNAVAAFDQATKHEESLLYSEQLKMICRRFPDHKEFMRLLT